MRIALVDDEARDREQLEILLRDYAALHRLDLAVESFACGEELLSVSAPFRFAIVFLDIYMEGITGLETAKRLRAADEDVVIVFLTTSEDHRADAFSLFATDYLVKPIREQAVYRTLDHILRLQTGRENRFAFSCGRRDYALPQKELVSLVTDGNYLTVTDCRGGSYRTRMTASTAEKALDQRFLVLLKGVMVNMDYVTQITDSACLIRGGGSLPINVRKAKELRQRLLNYKFAKIRRQSFPGEA